MSRKAIREVIHHGTYYNVRDTPIFGTAPSWAGFIDSLAASPYNANCYERPNEHVRQAYEDLTGPTGEGNIGWARYTLVDIDGHPLHVKTGLAGYGPDLEPDDEPFEELDAVLSAIQEEISSLVDMLHDEASAAGESGDFEGYYKARELADSLMGVRANFDPERRKAPLFNGDNAVDFDKHMSDQIAATFPLDVSTNGALRLYVWEVEA